MNVAEMYAEASAVAKGCRHPNATGYASSEIVFADKTEGKACDACLTEGRRLYDLARKAQLDARPRCMRCAVKPGTWDVGRYLLCGRCKTAVLRAHYRGTSRAGILAMTATKPLVDTSDWKGLPR